MIKEIKAVAFDIDGTLYPNYQLYFRIIPYFIKNLRFFIAFNKVRKILHRTAPLADYFEYQSRLLGEQMNISSEEAKSLIQNIVYDGLTPYFKKVKPYKHINETFIKFKEAGLKLAILSDFPPAQKGDIWGVAKYCDVILGSEECGALKPSKYPFGLMAKQLDCNPEEVLYVGNSIRCDIKGANNYSMKSAYLLDFWRKIFNKSLPEANISFKNYRQLQKIVLE